MITGKPSNKYIFKRHLTEDEDETMEPIEQYIAANYPTSYPSFGEISLPNTDKPIMRPTLNGTRVVNYVCVCNTQKSDEEKKITALIIATSLSSFSCILLIFFIIWYRFIFKKKLMNKPLPFIENFGIEGIDNDI